MPASAVNPGTEDPSLLREERTRAAPAGNRRRLLTLGALGLGIFVVLAFALHENALRTESWPITLAGALVVAAAFSAAMYFALVRPATHELAVRTQLDAQRLDVLNRAAMVEITDTQGRIVDANDAFCALSGYSRAELVGRTHHMMSSGRHSRAFFMAMFRTITMGQVWRGEICNKAKDGSLYWADTTIVPTRDERGRITRYTAIRIDITARKAAEENFADLNERHTRTIDGCGICLWDWDLVSGSVHVVGPFARMLGYGEAELGPGPVDTLHRFVPAADLAHLERTLEAHCRGETPRF